MSPGQRFTESISGDAFVWISGDIVLSKLMRKPVASNTGLDVIAAASCVLHPQANLAILGFSAGGLLAPLRALGHHHPVDGVDLDRTGNAVYREVTKSWPVPDARFWHEDASEWLERQGSVFDIIIEDLSVEEDGVVLKPWVSITALPNLMCRRLRPEGVAITNVLPRPKVSWKALLGNLKAPFRAAVEVQFEDYENRLLICGDSLPDPEKFEDRIKKALDSIKSNQAGKFEITSLA